MEGSFKDELLNSLQEALVYVEPVSNGKEIIDFEIIYCNTKGDEIISHPKGSILGLRILQDQIPSTEQCKSNFDCFLKVYETGREMEFLFNEPATTKPVETFRKRFKKGVLSNSKDRAAQRQAEKRDQTKTRILNGIIDNALAGIVVYKSVRDVQGKIIDFEIELFNDVIQQLTIITNNEKSKFTIKDLLKLNYNDAVFTNYVKTVETGEPFSFEYYYEPLDKWLHYVISKLDDGFLVILSDITERKETQLKIEEQKNLLDDIMKYSANGISVTEIIRDDKGAFYDGRTVIANDAAIKYTGLSKEEYLSKTALEIDPEFSSKPYFQICKNTLETGVPSTSQYYFEGADKWLEISISKMDNDHLITIFSDITVTKKAQLQLEQNANRIAAIFNASQSGMFTFTPVYNENNEIINFRFVIANPTFAAYVHQTPEALINELGSTYFPGYLTNGVFDMYKQTFITGETLRKDVHYNVDGLDIYLDLMSTKVANEVLVTFTDYTTLRKTQLQLEKSIEELKRSNANLEEFAYASSHDLKEPIRKINTFSNRLRTSLQERLSELESGLFDRMENATKRMIQLIDDLLEYSHVSIKQQELEDIDLNQKVGRVLDDLNLVLEEKKAKVHVDELQTIHGHRRQIQQLFQNLISNSLKYSKDDTPPEITITSTILTAEEAGLLVSSNLLKQPYYKIQVTDNGIGFEQKYSDKIFQVFQRLHGKSEYHGTGVGLSIAKKVVENHHGFITAEGEPGKGATFTIYLPVEKK